MNHDYIQLCEAFIGGNSLEDPGSFSSLSNDVSVRPDHLQLLLRLFHHRTERLGRCFRKLKLICHLRFYLFQRTPLPAYRPLYSTPDARNQKTIHGYGIKIRRQACKQIDERNERAASSIHTCTASTYNTTYLI
jgi:hypothetical protein